ncbi:MAG: hypothetical protein HOP33_03355 [Verrucomicrobia bacterium]|nr:hypothetical protein [Verrucomicrobiota bacterium]
METLHRTSNNIFRLLAGWCALLLYVGVFSPLGMGAVALLGTIDPDHHALFQPGTGGMRLVLHHEGKCSEHQHGAVTRALTLFAQPASQTDPDHVVQFAGSDGFWRDTQLIIVSGNSFDQPAILPIENLPSFEIQLLALLSPPAPPPDTVGNLLSLRSTVLLI